MTIYHYIVAVVEDKYHRYTKDDFADALKGEKDESVELNIQTYDDTKRCILCRRPMDYVEDPPLERVCHRCEGDVQSEEELRATLRRFLTSALRRELRRTLRDASKDIATKVAEKLL